MESNSKSILESEGLLQDLFYYANDLIQVVAQDGTLLYVNKAWSDVLGYGLKDIEGKSIYSFIASDDRNRYHGYRTRVIQGEVGGEPLIFMLTSQDGRLIIVEGRLSVRQSKDGVLFTMGVFRDISQLLINEKRLKQLNEDVKERDSNVQQLLTHAPDAIIVIDQDSIIKYWNPKAEHMFGWKADEVLNTSLTSKIVPHQHREAHEKGMRRYLATGIEHVLNRSVEITALNKTGREFYVSLTISRASQKSGIAFIAFLRDISEHKKSQLEIQEKTRQLEQSNKSLEAFAYAASHDLKEPIRKIQIFSERLTKSIYHQVDKVDQQFLDKILKATARMRKLIEDLLTYSSISSESSFSSEVNLNDVVRDAIDDLELEIYGRDIRLYVDELPTIKGNPRQLHQLFVNLLGNSVKYSKVEEANTIKVTYKMVSGYQTSFDLSDIEKNYSYHSIIVSDTGIGFNPDETNKIFQVFTRLHNQDQYQGSGVGLAIAAKAAENHRGFIKAEGYPGQGARFMILLPCDNPD